MTHPSHAPNVHQMRVNWNCPKKPSQGRSGDFYPHPASKTDVPAKCNTLMLPGKPAISRRISYWTTGISSLLSDPAIRPPTNRVLFRNFIHFRFHDVVYISEILLVFIGFITRLQFLYNRPPPKKKKTNLAITKW